MEKNKNTKYYILLFFWSVFSIILFFILDIVDKSEITTVILPTFGISLVVGMLISILIKVVQKNNPLTNEESKEYLSRVSALLEGAEKFKFEKKEKLSPLDQAWNYARTELTRFIEIQRQQTEQVFSLVVYMSIFGFVLILTGGIKALMFPATELSIASAEVLITASGLVIQLISAIILSIFKTTQESFSKNLKVLERQNLIGIIIQIIDDEKDSECYEYGKYKLETAKIIAENLTRFQD